MDSVGVVICVRYDDGLLYACGVFMGAFVLTGWFLLRLRVWREVSLRRRRSLVCAGEGGADTNAGKAKAVGGVRGWLGWR